jgi:hypothetical protein
MSELGHLRGLHPPWISSGLSSGSSAGQRECLKLRGILIKARSIASTRSIFKNGLDRPFLDETSKGAVDHRGPLSGKHIGLSHYPLRHWL